MKHGQDARATPAIKGFCKSLTRKGEIVLLGSDGYGFAADGQITDALREE